MKRGIFSILAILAVFAIVTLGCPEPTAAVTTPPDTSKDITLAAVRQDATLREDGTPTKTTSELYLNFDKIIEDLEAKDISLSGVTGVNKGALSRTGAMWTMKITGVTESGTLTVKVEKEDYNITGSPKTVKIHFSPPPAGATEVIFSSLTADGVDKTTATTTLTLKFVTKANNSPINITGLTAGHIKLSGVAGVTRGDFGSGATGTYTLPISGFTAGGTLTVEVVNPNANDYKIDGSASKTVTIFYVPTFTLSNVSQDGSAASDESPKKATTELRLFFYPPFTGLTADEITLSGVEGVTKGEIDNVSGAGVVYLLPISGFTADGTLSVKVEKAGNIINGSPKTGVAIYYVEAELSTPVAADYDISTNLAQTYGSVTAVTVTAKTGKSPGAVTVNYEGKAPTTYTKNDTLPKDAGTYTVTFDVAAATDWSAATGLSAGELVISPKAFGDTVTIEDIPDQMFAGGDVEPELVVKDGTTSLVEDTDYIVAFTNNKAAGTATATITGKGNYSGTKTADFTIIATNSGAILVYYWVDAAHGVLNTSGNTQVAPGAEVVITAQGTGYTVKEWSVDGKAVTDATGNTYTFKSNNKGPHNVSLVVEKDSKAYSATIPITVQ